MQGYNIATLISNAKQIVGDDLDSYLSRVAANPGLSCPSQLLLTKYRVPIAPICGKAALQHAGAKVKDTKAFPIIYPALTITHTPVIKPNDADTLCSADYDVIYLLKNGYIVEDEETTTYRNLTNRITEIAGAECKTDITQYKPGRYSKYDDVAHAFYLSTQCPKDKREAEMIAMYLDYYMARRKITDGLLYRSLQCVIKRHMGIPDDMPDKMINLIRAKSDIDYVDYLMAVSRHVWIILNELADIPVLNFTETAVLNAIALPDRMETASVFGRIRVQISDVMMQDTVMMLEKKIQLLSDADYDNIYQAKRNKKLYSYPPFAIPYDIKDYCSGWIE